MQSPGAAFLADDPGRPMKRVILVRHAATVSTEDNLLPASVDEPCSSLGEVRLLTTKGYARKNTDTCTLIQRYLNTDSTAVPSYPPQSEHTSETTTSGKNAARGALPQPFHRYLVPNGRQADAWQGKALNILVATATSPPWRCNDGPGWDVPHRLLFHRTVELPREHSSA